MDLFVGILELIIHARNKPRVIIIRGINFISGGNINILLVNTIVHLIRLPAIIDMEPRRRVGRIIFISSLIMINELAKLGPHNTTILNRTE
jgi:hypothetical protein